MKRDELQILSVITYKNIKQGLKISYKCDTLWSVTERGQAS